MSWFNELIRACVCLSVCSVYQEPLLTAAYTADRYQVCYYSHHHHHHHHHRCRHHYHHTAAAAAAAAADDDDDVAACWSVLTFYTNKWNRNGNGHVCH